MVRSPCWCEAVLQCKCWGSPAKEVHVNARVERIHCSGVDVVFEPMDTRPPTKLVIPFE